MRTAAPYAAARMRMHCGFTLVEVLVALVIMATLAVMAWRGVDGIMRTRDASQTRMENTLRLTTVLAQWEQDLASVQQTDAVPALAFDGATLRLTRRTDEGVQLVAWSLVPTTGTAEKSGAAVTPGAADNSGAPSNSWMRWTGPAVTESAALQDSWLRSQSLQGSEPGQLRTVGGVSMWQLYCFRSNAWTNCQSSGDVVKPNPLTGFAVGGSPQVPQAKTALPTGVRLVLTFVGGNGYDGTVTRDVVLGPQAP
jgi:general secretion pathway protein J